MKASCGDCAEKTKKFEGRIARGTFFAYRTVANFRSRHKKSERPASFPAKLVKGKDELMVEVPAAQFDPPIPFLELGPPGAMNDIKHARGLQRGEFRVEHFSMRSPEEKQELLSFYKADDIVVDAQIYPADFAMMIGKIGYCFAVFRYGLAAFETSAIADTLISDGSDIFQWVGGDGEQILYTFRGTVSNDHLVLLTYSSDGTVFARVKLLLKSPTPEYIVVVGKLNDRALAIYNLLGFV